MKKLMIFIIMLVSLFMTACDSEEKSKETTTKPQINDEKINIALDLSDYDTTITPELSSQKNAYIDSILVDYLSLSGNKPGDDYYISNPFGGYSFDGLEPDENSEMIFIFKGDTVIGMMNISYDNQFISSYSSIYEEVISPLYADNIPFAIVSVSGNVYAYYQNKLVPIYNDFTTTMDTTNIIIPTKHIIKERNFSFD